MDQVVQRATRSVRKCCWRVFLLAAAFYLLAGIGCARFQRRLIYFPPVLPSETVDELAKSARLEAWQSPTGKRIGWKRLSLTRPAQGQVLITHGNADCAFQCGHYADVIQATASLDVFIVEYPGYADKPGKPSEASLDAAADEAFRLLATNGLVYLVGESLGTGVAAYLAGSHPDQVAGLALLAPFNGLADVAQAHIVIFPVRWLLCDRFPAEDNLRDYHGPVAVLTAGRDTVVPERFGRRLYDTYTGPKRLWEFPQATHDTLMDQSPQVWREVISFWQLESSRNKRGASVEDRSLEKSRR
jgi:uncharacterized protein